MSSKSEDTSKNLSLSQQEPPTKRNKQEQIHVRVGVGVLVLDPTKPNAVYAGIRKGSHGSGCLALPGGHLEMYETWQECAAREVKEEMNLNLKNDSDNVKFVHVTNDIMKSENKHYITIFMMASSNGKEIPENMEPNKCEGWNSYTWNELQEISRKGEPKLFGPLKQLLEDNPESVEKIFQSSLSSIFE